ncbi:cytochrome c oxidase subunit 5B, mitochondrial-like [Artemia franciscana]|uniref:cytochrome c oxidase subunit 5B, mitochondrial-like n=1 Tax=Artemia franciscana TaxID=6661 RepID=UPI0032DBB9AD
MASLSRRCLFLFSRRSLSLTAAKNKDRVMPDQLEHATGLEKQELLAKLAGVEDPYEMSINKRGPGTKDCPNLVPSNFNMRVVGCVCEEDATSINWMWLYKGEPKRCECGYWFKLVEKKPVV